MLAFIVVELRDLVTYFQQTPDLLKVMNKPADDQSDTTNSDGAPAAMVQEIKPFVPQDDAVSKPRLHVTLGSML